MADGTHRLIYWDCTYLILRTNLSDCLTDLSKIVKPADVPWADKVGTIFADQCHIGAPSDIAIVFDV